MSIGVTAWITTSILSPIFIKILNLFPNTEFLTGIRSK
ncbi:hypothetical protein HMPREF1143_2031 [Peptoanaerobacter stomatis]|uniref:Uncharacterized protein n=1 Tax=Peptoanaerobacter stomatis TaxID=796937 RepID=J4WE29_9FIRM|nr:hypothetical protein HMPREF1143_2031 [Peptoanaerobacter stomatis]